MRRLFTTDDALASDVSMHALRWGVRAGFWTRIVRGVYGEGPEPPSALDRERALVLARSTVARGGLSGVLLQLDNVRLDGRPTRAGAADVGTIIDGIPCATALQTLIDLAALVDDDRWEQALETALRKRLVTVAEIESALPALARARATGIGRIRRVLSRRPVGAPATESLLETLALQLARTVPQLGEPTRQHEVRSPTGIFVARVDLCWPVLGLFFELDGQHHPGQPVYDANRETAVVATTGWLPGRFTWYEIVHIPRSTARRFDALVDQSLRRPAA